MQVKKIKSTEHTRPPPYGLVTEKKAGNIVEVRFQTKSSPQRIKKLNRDSFLELSTGEVRNFEHSDFRISHMENISRSLRKLRDLINTNVTAENAQNCQWVTLTYRANMTDPKRLYSDFHNFNLRYQRYLKKHGFLKAEYIACIEPQQRRAWHVHVIFIFPDKAPFIENAILAKIWRQGFVSIKALKDVDNVGAYLTAYLGDLEAPGNMDLKKVDPKRLKYVGKRKKAIIKGARLCFYPSGIQIFRHSRGIKKPELSQTTEVEVMKDVEGAALTYEKTIQLFDDQGQMLNQINYRQYNRVRKKTVTRRKQ